MVDVKQIEKLLKKHFVITGSYNIDPNSGVVDVQGDVSLIKNNIQKLPVQFGHVTGHFNCSDSKLTSLSGAPNRVDGNFFCDVNKLLSLSGGPDQVGGDFWAHDNLLTTLRGAPVHVGGLFTCADNPLSDMVGAPEHVVGTFFLTYNKELPLLRLCMYKSIHLYWSPAIIDKIIKPHLGEGKPGALKVAAEMIRAGYRENARW